jgi:hypothetical protein
MTARRGRTEQRDPVMIWPKTGLIEGDPATTASHSHTPPRKTAGEGDGQPSVVARELRREIPKRHTADYTRTYPPSPPTPAGNASGEEWKEGRRTTSGSTPQPNGEKPRPTYRLNRGDAATPPQHQLDRQGRREGPRGGAARTWTQEL